MSSLKVFESLRNGAKCILKIQSRSENDADIAENDNMK